MARRMRKGRLGTCNKRDKSGRSVRTFMPNLGNRNQTGGGMGAMAAGGSHGATRAPAPATPGDDFGNDIDRKAWTEGETAG